MQFVFLVFSCPEVGTILLPVYGSRFLSGLEGLRVNQGIPVLAKQELWIANNSL